MTRLTQPTDEELVMALKPARLFGTAFMAISLFCLHRSAHAAEAVRNPLVRLAELDIDLQQLEAYKIALKEEIAASIRLEPGVLTLYAVSVKDHPEQIRLFETYKDEAAYQAHLRSPHFLAYKGRTQGMIKSFRLIETEPVMLGAK